MRLGPDDYKKPLQILKAKRGLIVHVVDIFDFPGSAYPALEEIVGSTNPVLVVANKADLLLSMGPDAVWLRRGFGIKATGWG